ncbi:MAG: divergent polysaccharide deacetylase family protein [bacterium]|nr:divergent polysaccharide deacetylase family protein [bacterium]
MKRFFLVLLLIILVFIGFFLASEYLRKTRIERIERDYTNQSKRLAEIIDNELTNLKVYPRDVLEKDEEMLCKGKTRWLHITKKVLVPGSHLLDDYKRGISKAIQKVNVGIIDSSRSDKSLRLDIGIEDFPFYSLTLTKVPSVGIIIDDFGFRKKANNTFLQMELPLSFSILPGRPISSIIAKEAERKGFETMLHLPMEPHGYPEKNPGEYAIMSNMSDKEIIRQTLENIKNLPGIIGVNNHMGSKVTEDKRIMSTVLKELKKEGLFFVDSRTSRNSVAYKVARELGVGSGENRVFLDNERDIDYIKERIGLLADIALKEGGAIGLGHVNEETARAIKESLPLLKDKGVRLVYVSQLVK